ncbi:MAG: saccharopine dehydrogenase [Pseudomonadota bacterium]
MAKIWMRMELKPDERRAPIAPADAAKLIAAGHQVHVEDDANRAIPTTAYRDAGCAIEAPGAWVMAPDDAWIIAVKEMPEGDDFPLPGRYIHFGHLFKGQTGWRDGLRRFADGGGVLYDLEFLTNAEGRRVAAFGYWAGYAGAALGLRLWAGLEDGERPGLSPVAPFAGREDLAAYTRAALAGRTPRALITGALGRCGRGARDLCEAVGVETTDWDMAETGSGGPFPEILQHDVLVNAVLASPACPVFVPSGSPGDPNRRLTAIADVSCDPTSDYNPIPVYNRSTTFSDPANLVTEDPRPLSVMAIDHLPSLLPVEATEDYSEQLLPALMTLDGDADGIWGRAKAAFDEAVGQL